MPVTYGPKSQNTSYPYDNCRTTKRIINNINKNFLTTATTKKGSNRELA